MLSRDLEVTLNSAFKRARDVQHYSPSNVQVN